jgi:hypothetical protein
MEAAKAKPQEEKKRISTASQHNEGLKRKGKFVHVLR